VAEGIETKEQAERMRTLGCTYGQGYYFAKPISATEIEAGVEGLANSHRWDGASKHRATRRRRALGTVTKGQPATA